MAHEKNKKSTDGGNSSSYNSSQAPPRARWFYARDGGGDWVAFPAPDDERLEGRFQDLGGEKWWKQESERRQKEKKEEKRREGNQEEDHDEEGEREQPTDANEQAGRDAEEPSWTDKLTSWVPGLNSTSQEVDEKKDQLKQRSDADGEDDAEHLERHHDPDSPPMVEEILDPDEPESARRAIVPVLEDSLFDVDLVEMHLYPAFFKGVLLKVVRSTWFYWSEMRGSYSPVSWQSGFATDLEGAWKETEAWKLPAEDEDAGQKKRDKEEAKTRFIEIRSKGTSSGKGRVCFTSPVEGQVFTQDLRGRIVSLVGGFTVLRGFDEVERRTLSEEGKDLWSRNLFDLPDMPWRSEGDKDWEEKVNEKVRPTGRAGAAQPDEHKPKAGGGGYGSQEASSKGKGQESKAENEGFAAKLWPSSDAWMRPGYAVLRAFGYSDGDAREETRRKGKQRSTEKAVEPDSEARKRASKDKDNDDEGEGGDDDDNEQKTDDDDDDDEDEGAASTQPEQDSKGMDDLADDPVHLVLVIHGIGQGLRDDFESIDFTHDCAKLRSVSKERCQDSGVRRLARGRRAQFLPVCWRRGIDFEHRSEGNDNHFGLEDVTNQATMPLVRNVVSKVILDVPFYLSPIYKAKFIKAVIAELNRCYRLWVRRNPGWLEKGGQVSIIGHSLGSVLAADILSQQPTHVPRLDEMSNEEVAKAQKERLLFDTTHLFLVGSPLGLFLLLGGGQLIARRTTPAKTSIGEDASSDCSNEGECNSGDSTGSGGNGEGGKYGCMSLRGNLYNIYNESDPVAYRISAAVDREYAKHLRPTPLPGAVAAILDTLKGPPRMSVSSFFDKQKPFASVWGKAAAGEHDQKEGQQDDVHSEDKGGLTSSTSPPLRWGETRDERVDDGNKDKLKDWMANKVGDKKDEEGQKTKKSHDSNSGPPSELPSGIVTPVRVESGHDVKESLPLRLAKDAAHKDTRRDSAATTASASSSSSASPSLSTLLDSYARAERRFRALNSHGCLDYSYVSDVVSRFDSTLTKTTAMLGAHQSYWGSKSFVSLVLTQVFDSEEAQKGQQGDGPKKEEVTLVPPIKGLKKDDGGTKQSKGDKLKN